MIVGARRSGGGELDDTVKPSEVRQVQGLRLTEAEVGSTIKKTRGKSCKFTEEDVRMPRTGKRGRRRLSLVVIAITLASGGALFFTRSLIFPALVDQGTAAYDRGDWVTAAACASARLKTVPDDKQALRLLARSSMRQHRDNLARKLYAQVGGIEAMEAEDYYLFGTFTNRLGDHEAARECWENSLHADPSHAGSLGELARLHLGEGRYSDAADLVSRLAKRPGWEARADLLLGQIMLAQDEPAEAVVCLRRALALDPAAREDTEPPSFYRKLLARALLRTEHSSEAASQLRTVLDTGSDPEASWLLSRAYLQSGSLNEATAALEQGDSYRDEHSAVPEPAMFVGSARCAQCHALIHQTEQTSLHALTFQRAAELKALELPQHPISDPARAGVSHRIERSGEQLRFETDNRGKLYQAVVDYAFGSGDRGLTMVGRDETGRARELRLSYYGDGSGWDLTPGHTSEGLAGEDHLGQELTNDDVQSCFYCHTTVPRSARNQTGPESADRGIGCERCHGPGANHLKAVALKFRDMAIARPHRGDGTGHQIVALCGQCHSPLGKDVGRDDPLAVRFPATNLTWSRCYLESGGTFDCLTCHSPHRNAEQGSAYYEAKCLSCHSSTAARITAQHSPTAQSQPGLVCKVSPGSGCIPCHMPKIKTAIPHSVFADHNIRVRPQKSAVPQAERAEK
jgi:tetratricopeptide (TPR) repeat protein